MTLSEGTTVAPVFLASTSFPAVTSKDETSKTIQKPQSFLQKAHGLGELPFASLKSTCTYLQSVMQKRCLHVSLVL